MSYNTNNFDEVNGNCSTSSHISTECLSTEAIFGTQPKAKLAFGKKKTAPKANIETVENEKLTQPAPIIPKKEPKQSSSASAEDKAAHARKLAFAKIASAAGEKELVEPIYTSGMEINEDICVAEKSENLVFYKWVGNYWKGLTKKRAEADALAWLQKNFPERATANLAFTCASTAALSLLNKRPIPEKGNSIIIPLIDRWLVIQDDGTILNKAPDRAFGITHQINATLGAAEEKFEPRLLPVESMFAKFLNSSLPATVDQELLQEWIGSTLLPDTRYQKAMVLEGPGSNGKGVLTEIVSALHQNVAAINLDKLDGFGLSELPDASLAVVAETPKRGLNEEMLKQIIAGDRIVIDIKKQSQFTCKPFAKFLISCNAFPKINDESDGVWRRLIILKFLQKFSGAAKINNLAQKIIDTEMLHVLEWALIGLQRLLKRGENGDFIIPAHIKANTDEERANSNNVVAYIEDTYLAYSEKVSSKDSIYEAYVKYCENRHLSPFGDVQFWKRITHKFPELVITQKRELEGRRRYVNLGVDLSQAEKEVNPLADTKNVSN